MREESFHSKKHDFLTVLRNHNGLPVNRYVAAEEAGLTMRQYQEVAAYVRESQSEDYEYRPLSKTWLWLKDRKKKQQEPEKIRKEGENKKDD